MASGGGGDGEPEFQIAPMIDVLIVLLVFFMSITSTQVLQVDKTVQLPLAPDAKKKDDKRSEAIINVRWDEATEKPTFVVNERVYATPSELTPALQSARIADEKSDKHSDGKNFRVVIRGDRNAHAAAVSQAMNAAAEAGIVDVSFSAMNKD